MNFSELAFELHTELNEAYSEFNPILYEKLDTLMQEVEEIKTGAMNFWTKLVKDVGCEVDKFLNILERVVVDELNQESNYDSNYIDNYTYNTKDEVQETESKDITEIYKDQIIIDLPDEDDQVDILTLCDNESDDTLQELLSENEVIDHKSQDGPQIEVMDNSIEDTEFYALYEEENTDVSDDCTDDCTYDEWQIV